MTAQRTHTVRDVEALAALEAAWARLADSAGTLPTQDPAWSLAAANAFAAPGELHVVALEAEDGLEAVAPLVLRSGRLELLGVTELFEPSDLLAATPAALQRLCEALARSGRPLRLERLPAGSATPAALGRAIRVPGRSATRPGPPWPELRLEPAWAVPGGGLSSRRRSDLRRAMRRAEAEGVVAVRLLTPVAAEVDAALDVAFNVEALSWKGTAGTALAADPRRAAFFRDLAHRSARDGRLRVAFLDVGERVAAMQVALDRHGSRWLLKIGYDAGLSRCSPGLLLLAEDIAAAADAGLTSYQLLGTADDWVRPWSSGLRETVTVHAYPAHPRAAGPAARDAVLLGGRAARRASRSAAKSTRRAAVRVAESRYLAGPALEDALRVEGAYRARGLATTVGYWNAEADPAGYVRAEYRAQIEALAGLPDGQISIKAPAIGGDAQAVAELLDAGAAGGLGVHLDALAPETQDATLAIALELGPGAAGRLGCTLSGRWPRSVADARQVGNGGLRVRVVKSEWPSPEAPEHDPRRGFLDVVAALAPARPVLTCVATHDAPLARRALGALLDAGAPCELQVLHGMRAAPAMAVARELGVPVRVYVPYGHGRLPYSLEHAAREPRTALRLARDLVRRNRAL